MKKCGFVSILGETNAGKSTLINKLVGQKISIVSRKVQTTLMRILGIAIYGDSQIILMDTPGFSSKTNNEGLEKTAWEAFRESQHVLFVVDVNKKSFSKSISLLEKIHSDKKVSLILNKVDLIHKPKLLEIASIFNKVRSFQNIFMISALTDDGVDEIKHYLENEMPQEEWIFPEDEVTDLSLEKFTAEITREHLYHRVHQEIPYKCRIETKSYENKPDGSVVIKQDIYVKNKAHKVVLLGHKGGKIKAIGEASRKELVSLLDKEVHLFLQVLIDKC